MILKLCSWEETGGIISAMTTSVATSPTQEAGSQRDLRYCFMRDAALVVRSMNQLNITELMERYRSFVDNAKINHPDTLQSVYGIGLENRLVDKTVRSPFKFNVIIGLTGDFLASVYRFIGWRATAVCAQSEWARLSTAARQLRLPDC